MPITERQGWGEEQAQAGGDESQHIGRELRF